MPALLIAGPLALDDHLQQAGLLGGAGGYAAMAAAPLAPTQLWCRAGNGIDARLRGLLETRRIDLSGVAWEGPTPRSGPAGFVPGGPLLPDIEPTSAEDLGGALLIGLPPDEWRRARAVIDRLPGAAERPIFASPRPADLEAPAFRAEVCRGCTVLVLSVTRAQALSGTADPLAAAQAFQALGAKAVALTASQLGGVLAYQALACTWPAQPVPSIDRLGVSAAFAGALSAWIAGSGKRDFQTCKRACWVAGCAAALCAGGTGPKRLLAADRGEILDRFEKLRRLGKC